MARRFGRRILGVALVLLCLALSTCITATQHSRVIYNPATDEFRLLMLLEHIGVKDANDLEYLEAIHRNRDHLLAPLPFLTDAVGPTLVRLGDRRFAAIGIFGARPKTLDATPTTTASLNSVKVTPGTFFLENKTLSYYHAITIPGKTVDAALDDYATQARWAWLADAVESEQDRRTNGGHALPWAEVKQAYLNAFSRMMPASTLAAPGENEDVPNPLKAMEFASLDALESAISHGTLRVQRNKQVFTLKLPLSATDADHFLELLTEAREKVAAMLRTAPGNAEAGALVELRHYQAVDRAFKIAKAEGGITISIDYPAALAAMDRPAGLPPPPPAPPAPDAAPEPPPPDPIAYLRQRGIAIDETLTAAEVLRAFAANTLPAHVSEKPVPPGEGLAKPEETQ